MSAGRASARPLRRCMRLPPRLAPLPCRVVAPHAKRRQRHPACRPLRAQGGETEPALKAARLNLRRALPARPRGARGGPVRVAAPPSRAAPPRTLRAQGGGKLCVPSYHEVNLVLPPRRAPRHPPTRCPTCHGPPPTLLAHAAPALLGWMPLALAWLGVCLLKMQAAPCLRTFARMHSLQCTGIVGSACDAAMHQRVDEGPMHTRLGVAC